MSKMKLWGFDGSTYVRTVKMLLAEKQCTDFEQVQVNVLAGEPKQPDHLARHPFGKVPVLDHDGMRLLETSAITRYLNDVLPGKSLVPATPQARAKMDMIVGIFDSYGYGALVGGVAAYHLFPDFVGGKNEGMRKAGARDRAQGHRARDEDQRRVALHRRRAEPGRSLPGAGGLLRLADARHGEPARDRRLCRLVGEGPGAAELQGHAAGLTGCRRGEVACREILPASSTWRQDGLPSPAGT